MASKLLSFSAAFALTAAQPPPPPPPPPASLFNLTNWLLQLPVSDGKGSIVEITQPALSTYSSSYFYSNLTGGAAMQFWTPENGAKTPNSKYPRSELREVKSGGDWTIVGTHVMNVTTAVMAVPDPSVGVTVGQIHTDGSGSCSIVAEIIWKAGKLVAYARDASCSTVALPLGNFALGQAMSFDVWMVDKNLYASTNQAHVGPYPYSWFNTSVLMYMKQGNYLQFTGSSQAASIVSTTKLVVTHSN